VLAAVDPSTLSETELMAWALPRAANQFWMLSEPERATAFLLATRGRVTSPAAQTTLDALSATFAMNAGNPSRAKANRRRSAGVAGSRRHRDRMGCGCSGAEHGPDGPFIEVDALAERAIAAGHPGLLRFTSGFGQTTTLLMAGELDRCPGAGPAAHRLCPDAAAGPRDR